MKEHQKLDRRRKGERELKDQLEQSLATLDKHSTKIDQFLKTASPDRFLLLQNMLFPHPCGSMGQGKWPKEIKSNITDNESGKMLTSKGTLRGYNGAASVVKKHQIIVDAQAFGESQEHHTLKPVLGDIRQRYDEAKFGDLVAD